ncbi:PucR family transcriptional regulator [Staphylococcus sp. 17KM0847]|uniref:PucR family transcriptional regulator n=1 Tax=Staphylococcus sp. 17KM0847 TaxID=2583989 RepID=UPI0015DD25BF|nr:PucR family transcriptional regulator [Staphylococcus sp. 17KM0847]QLK85370.1 PucR family transcriptional regulator [Staphylococcus sp. 17KM0847]
MTVLKDIMAIELFSGLKLINSKGDLQRVVEFVDISETPDIKDYISENTLLLTTAMSYKDNQHGLIQLIDELYSVNVAGLGIKLSRFLQKVDPEVIDYANKLQFPLIEIPYYWKLGSITHEIASYLADDENEKLNFALDLQQKMNKMIVNEYTIDKVIDQLSKLIKAPILLINPFLKIESESQYFRKNPRASNYYLKKFTDNFNSQSKKVDFDENEYAVYEVPAFNYFPYYIMILEIQKLTYPFSYLAIEQAVNVLSFAIYKEKRLIAQQQEDINQFFESLMKSKDSSPIDISQNPDFFKQYHLKHSNYYQVIICGVDREEGMENSIYLSERYQMTFAWLKEMLETIDDHISIYGLHNDFEFVILMQKKHENYIEYCKFLQKEYKKIFNSSLSFGIGNQVTDFKQISLSFIEANEVYDTHNNSYVKEFIEIYRSKNVEELLQLIPVDKLRPFVIYTLGPLAYPTQTKDKELKKTLKVYMENQCDITKTASLMYVHRNTVKYRINKCEELLKMDISNPKNSLDIRLAIFTSEHLTL